MSAPSSTAKQQAVALAEQSALYKAVMTPVIFVTFLVSLAVVDYRNSAKRSHYHAESRPNWLPPWLHSVIYRSIPYQYVSKEERDQVTSVQGCGRPYYHSKQRKLIKMEVSEAFEMRGGVVFVLGMLMMPLFWGVSRLALWGCSALWRGIPTY